MFGNFIFYLQLSWFCLRLLSNLATFSLAYFLTKLNQQKLLSWSLLILIMAVCLLNISLWQKRNAPETIFERIGQAKLINQNSGRTERVEAKREQIQNLIAYYSSLDSRKIMNRGLFLNLSQLNQAMQNSSEQSKYLEKAKFIEP